MNSKVLVATWSGEEKPERGGVTQPGVNLRSRDHDVGEVREERWHLDDKEEREVSGLLGGESSMKLLPACSLLYADTEWPKVPTGQLWDSE